MRLAVAQPAAVTMFMAPGPMEETQGMISSLFFCLAKAMAARAMFCSFLPCRKRMACPPCCSAWPTPTTQPWPKTPNRWLTNLCSTPSSSTYWLSRKRTSAWAMVRRMVSIKALPPAWFRGFRVIRRERASFLFVYGRLWVWLMRIPRLRARPEGTSVGFSSLPALIFARLTLRPATNH